MKQELKTIHCYDVASFVAQIEKAVKEGFSLDLVTPQNYPQMIGYQFIATMVNDAWQSDKASKAPPEPVEAPVAQKEEVGSQDQVQEVVEAPKKAGRPAKGK